MENINIWYIILFIICLLASAFFCSAETAFIGIQRLRLQHLIHNKHPNAKIVARILEKPEKFLATVLVGINFFETAVAALGTVIAVMLWGNNWGAAIATIVVTIVTLVVAEFIPKSLATRYGEKIALAYARPIEFISLIFYPFVYVLNHIGIRFTRVAKGETELKPTISEEEFRTAITVGEAEGVWEEDEAEMLHKVFEFADRPVYEAMTPRTEIVWVEKGATLATFLNTYRLSPHSRFPVYKDNTDNVIGVLFIRDVLMAQANNKLGMDDPVDELTRPAFFVPETKLLGELLSEMKDKHYKMAIIVDEFGGVAGIATMDQLIEEIVGDISDELGEQDKDIVTIDANTYELDGGLRIEDANNELGLGLPSGDYETVAGFVLSHLRRIPRQGEHLRYHGLKITILEMKAMKIEKILVTREGDAASKN